MIRAQADPATSMALGGAVPQSGIESHEATVIHFAQGVDKGVDWRHITVDGTGKHVFHLWTSVRGPRPSRRPPTTAVDAAIQNGLRRRNMSTVSTVPMDKTRPFISTVNAQVGRA